MLNVAVTWVSLSTVTESAYTPAYETFAVVSVVENWNPEPVKTKVFPFEMAAEVKLGKFPLANDVYRQLVSVGLRSS